MARRRQAVKRPVIKDGKYNSTLVSRLVNTVMECGKKSVAQRIVYAALDQIAAKNPASSPLEILQRAVDNAKPRLEVKTRRVGGATYQVPLEVPPDRQFALALRWIVDFADARKGIPMKEALAAEIMEAFQDQGNAIRKRDEVHKMRFDGGDRCRGGAGHGSGRPRWRYGARSRWNRRMRRCSRIG